MRPDELAALVAAEREACAKACEDLAARLLAHYKAHGPDGYKAHSVGMADGANRCAAVIRSRKGTT